MTPRVPRRGFTANARPKDCADIMSTTHPTSSPDDPAAQEPEASPPALRVVNGHGRSSARQLALDYDWEVSPGVPAIPPVPRGLRLVGAAAPDDVDPGEGLPDPGPWVARLARAVVEVSVGERPPGQLTRWVSRDVLAGLARRGTVVARHPSARAQRGVTRIRTVRAVRVCPVAPGIVETSAVLVGTDRAQAIAVRLEAVEGRWLATAIEMR